MESMSVTLKALVLLVIALAVLLSALVLQPTLLVQIAVIEVVLYFGLIFKLCNTKA